MPISALLLATLSSTTAQAANYQPLFKAAAAEYSVPEPILLALAYEASRFDPTVSSAWGGYGMFDFREDDEGGGPGIEKAAMILGESPDAIRARPELQIEAAAALLAYSARAHNGGQLPAVKDLEAWSTAVVSFSGRQEPDLQALFVQYIYEVIDNGFFMEEAVLIPVDVNPWNASGLAYMPPPPAGDYAGISQYVAASSSNYSNYSRGPEDINYVVIHTVQGSYSGCISWFQNSSASVSAHYVVRSSDGAVTQMVMEEDVAWHAGNWTYNEQSVGIEHEGYVDDPGKWYTDAMYTGSAKLTADIAKRNGIPTDRSHIIGHVEVPGATHTDPGSGWDWDKYMGLIDGGTAEPTAELLGVVADTDIYDGERLVGATVTLSDGQTTTVDADGYYHFEGLDVGSWTATASAPGYEPASCTKSISSASGQWWCSIALTPSPEDTGPDDSPVDTGGDTDTTTDDTGKPEKPKGPPGEREDMEQVGACGSPGLPGMALAALGAALLGRRRR